MVMIGIMVINKMHKEYVIMEDRRVKTTGDHKQACDKQFVGYKDLSLKEAKVLKLSDGQREVSELQGGQQGFVFFQQTPFYAESGGQVADRGEIKDPSSNDVIADVTDCQKYADMHCHTIILKDNHSLKKEDVVCLQVDSAKRAETAKHHTATHLLHASLKKHLEVLIDEKEQEKMSQLYPNHKQEKAEVVMQRGSYVAPDHLRFDFTYSKPLTEEQKSKIEQHINQQITKALPVKKETMSLKDAKNKGALAFFGEKYPEDNVRVINIGDKESIELCGGTHVDNTNAIQAFVIVQEENISAGVRRIQAIVGQEAITYLLENNRKFVKAEKIAQVHQPLDQYIKSLKENNKTLRMQFQKNLISQININQLMEKFTQVKDGQQVQLFLETDDRKLLSQIVDRMKDKLSSGVVILFGKGAELNKSPLIVAVTKNITKCYNASQILKQYGVGGGRPDFAQGYYKYEDLNLKDKNINMADKNTQKIIQGLKDLV